MRNKRGIVSILAVLVIMISVGSLFVSCNHSGSTPTEKDITVTFGKGAGSIEVVFSSFDTKARTAKFKLNSQLGTMAEAAEITGTATFNEAFTKLTLSDVTPEKAKVDVIAKKGLCETQDAYDVGVDGDVTIATLAGNLSKVTKKLGKN